MKEIRIIGDEIYYDNVLVAKLVESPNHTIQGEFVDEINSLDTEDTYEEKYEAERLVSSLKRTKDNKDTLEDIESALSNIRNALDYMYEEANA